MTSKQFCRGKSIKITINNLCVTFVKVLLLLLVFVQLFEGGKNLRKIA